MAWIVTEEAADDLQQIYENGLLNFGDSQSREYQNKLLDAFDRLAAMPLMAPRKTAASGDVHLMPCGSHHILYVVQCEDVVILRILHGLQDWFELL